jgi:hypothetical protein
MLNDAGSLYYWAYPKWFDIVDVKHGVRRMRFALSETVKSALIPMAIDRDGARVFLITDKGLTVVDLGDAPVSIGSLDQTSVRAGMQIEVRGSGFQPGITASLGGAATGVTRVDSSTLLLSVPSVSSGLQDIVVTNPDGMSYTLESAVTVE